MSSNLYEESENGASLPNVEELKLDVARNSPVAAKRNLKKFWIVVGGAIVALGGVVALFVTAGENRNILKKAKTNSAQSWDDSQAVLEPEHESLSITRAESRLGDVMTFLSASITEAFLFEDQNSAQYKAARWLADQDFMNMPIPDADPKDYAQTFWFVQRYVLAVFYFSTTGANWRYKSYFMSDYDVCDWNMLFQADTPPEGIEATQWTYGISCNDGGEVTDIMFSKCFGVNFSTFPHRYPLHSCKRSYWCLACRVG